MLVLMENNLSKRHQELNAKVNEAAAVNVSFDEVKEKKEYSDVDRLFKIKLASKYKKTDYIIDILKSGDSLLISHALKCLWMYDNEHSNIINPDYLHHNIMPFMSSKMKKKMLSAISMYIRDEERAKDFFNYCMNINSYNIAIKFLPFVAESLKLTIINEVKLYHKLHDAIDSDNIWQNIIGNSFNLAQGLLEAKILKTHNKYAINIMHSLRHLYFLNDNRYLDLLESYADIKPNYRFYRVPKFGSRISKDILKKHKDRVLKLPIIYVNILKINMITKNFSSCEAKVLINRLLPNEACDFWELDFCTYYKGIINIIPFEERFEFIRNIFTEKYPNKTFDNYREFHRLKYYEMMSVEQTENWAMKHIEVQDDIKACKIYRWYEFVTFQKAFKDIKKYVMTCPDHDLRCYMVNVLAKCTKTQMELETLLKYYYERHVNEKINYKSNFIDKVLENHNILTVDESCWTVFNKLLYSVKFYEASNRYSEYKAIAIFYLIIHNKQVPEELHYFIDGGNILQSLKYDKPRVNEDKQDIIFKYFFHYYLNKIKNFRDQNYTDDIKEQVKKPIHNFLDLIHCYGKQRDEIPKLIMEFIELDWEKYSCHSMFFTKQKQLKQGYLIRLLKNDASLVIKELSEVKRDIYCLDFHFDLNQLSRKLKIYFANDIAKDYLNFLLQIVNDRNISHTNVCTAVYGIFQIADENFNIEFMTKHIPEEPKIDHSKIDRHLLYIQEAICRSAGFSRPPVPLSIYLKYMQGDYVQYCLPVFNTYFVNLTPPHCLKFIQSVIDTPLSVQKHAVRLAFKCFTAEKLANLVPNIWRKTKNVTFRLIIYDLLYKKVASCDSDDERKLFEVLKNLILDLNDEDDDSLFSLFKNGNMKEHLRGDYIATFWELVRKLPDRPKNLNRMTVVVNVMIENINLLKQDFVRVIVNEHLQIMLVEKQIRPDYGKPELNTLNETKWRLVEKYIFTIRDKRDEVENLDIVKFIMSKCFEMWHEVNDDIYTIRKFCLRFVKSIAVKCIYYDILQDYIFQSTVLEYLIKELLDNSSLDEIYLNIWDLRFTLLTMKTLHAIEEKFKDCEIAYKEVKEIISVFTKELGDLLKDNVYLSFISDIAMKVSSNIERINRALCLKRVTNKDDLCVIIADELLDLNTKVVYLVALNIFPVDYENNENSIISKDDAGEVMKKFKTLEDSEVRAVSYLKFVGSDFKRRKYF